LREEFKAAKGCRWVEVRTESKNDAAGESAAVLRQNPDITAAIACTDHLAADLYRAAQHLGWKIPGRLSVLGVGGLDFGPLLSPPLTSIAQNGLALGRKAAETVLGRSLGKISGPPRHYKIPVQPAAGSSTAARLPTR
jgi:LacI family transcriptional regulator